MGFLMSSAESQYSQMDFGLLTLRKIWNNKSDIGATPFGLQTCDKYINK
jgi:hypothetical protein